MRLAHLWPCLACIPAFAAGPAWPQDSQTMSELVVTANRVPTPTDNVGSAISVYTEAELEERQIRRVEDALRQIPGLTIRRAGSVGTPTTINMRGLGPRNTLVLLDGIEINDPSRSQVQYEFGAIPVQDIARIEVLRGPQSSLYGSDASGGVINIITKKATKPFEGSLSGEVGGYASKQANAAVRGNLDKIDYGVSLSGFDTKGTSSFSRYRGGSEADGHQNASGAANLGLQMTDDWRIEAQGRHSVATVLSDFQTADVTLSYYEKKETFARIQTSLDTFDARWRHTLGTSHSKHEREFKGRNNGSNGDSYDGYKDKIDYQSRFEIDQASSLIAGAENERERLDQRATRAEGGNLTRGIVDKINDTQGYYLSYAVNPLKPLNLTASLRRDEHQKFGGATTWRLTGAYRIEETDSKLRTSYGTGFVAPSLYELHDPCIGRPELQPERSKGWDIGLDQNFLNRKVSLSGTYFESRVKNQITFVTTGIACGIFTGNYQNIDKTLSRGFELGGNAKLTSSLTLAASYTYTHAKNALTGQSLFDIPKHQGHASLDWRYRPEASVGLGVTYRDNSRNSLTRTNSEYAAFEFRASYDVTDSAELYGRVENLFDARYEDIWGYGTPGRTAYLGTRVKF